MADGSRLQRVRGIWGALLFVGCLPWLWEQFVSVPGWYSKYVAPVLIVINLGFAFDWWRRPRDRSPKV